MHHKNINNTLWIILFGGELMLKCVKNLKPFNNSPFAFLNYIPSRWAFV